MSARSATDSRGPAPSTPRHHAREAALQMLYQWEVGRVSIDDAVKAWPRVAEDDSKAVSPFAARLAHGVAARVSDIDPLISEAASTWRIERMNVLDRLILRLAIYELLEEPDTPASVIIDEAIELARSFSSSESLGFVNGVVDAVRRKLERR
jgi:N utilization substance protein B